MNPGRAMGVFSPSKQPYQLCSPPGLPFNLHSLLRGSSDKDLKLMHSPQTSAKCSIPSTCVHSMQRGTSLYHTENTLYSVRETNQLFVLTTRTKYANTVCDQNAEDLGVKTVLTRNCRRTKKCPTSFFSKMFLGDSETSASLVTSRVLASKCSPGSFA